MIEFILFFVRSLYVSAFNLLVLAHLFTLESREDRSIRRWQVSQCTVHQCIAFLSPLLFIEARTGHKHQLNVRTAYFIRVRGVA